MDNKTKQFIADKVAQKWIKENKDLLKDYQELCVDLLMFRAKWGIEIGFIFKNPEEVKGRELGKGIVEEMFDAQDATNKKESESKKPFFNMRKHDVDYIYKHIDLDAKDVFTTKV